SDYNVLALAAPDIAAIASPGQFVMLRPGTGRDPLLRRPFSIFEILRGADGAATGLSILSKRIGASTSLLYDAREDQRIDCLGPLGRPFTIVEPPSQDWMIAGGVGLALTTEDGSLGERGRVIAPLDRRLADLPAAADVMLHACGPEGMLAAAAR